MRLRGTGKPAKTDTSQSKDAVKEALAEARAVFKAGDVDRGIALHAGIAEAHPDNARAVGAYARALAKRRPEEAETHILRALELEPGDDDLRCDYAQILYRAGRFDNSAAILTEILERSPDDVRSMRVLADSEEQRGRIDAAFALYRRILELEPDKAGHYGEFAGFLNRLAQDTAAEGARRDEGSAKLAAAHAIALSRSGKFEDAKGELERAAQLDPGVVDLRRELLAAERLKHAGDVIHRRPAPWPTRSYQFENFEKLVKRYVLAETPTDLRWLSQTSKVATMGSCFAIHVAQRLQARGIDAFYKLIAEDINNTYANSYLLDWVLEGAHDAQTQNFDALFGEDERQEWKKALSECDLFIFSLGLAPSFFDRETGDFVLQVGGDVEGAALAELYQHRTTTVEENVTNLTHLIAQLRRLNPDTKIVLTVSPVALGGTYERSSAVLADCVSKSTLRVAVEQVLALGLPDVLYWPSFEIARWLGGHIPVPPYDPPFSADDGRTRHVSVWLQDLIIGLFVEVVGDGTIGPPAADAATAATASDT